jgi:hypothetical protein
MGSCAEGEYQTALKGTEYSIYGSEGSWHSSSSKNADFECRVNFKKKLLNAPLLPLSRREWYDGKI